MQKMGIIHWGRYHSHPEYRSRKGYYLELEKSTRYELFVFVWDAANFASWELKDTKRVCGILSFVWNKNGYSNKFKTKTKPSLAGLKISSSIKQFSAIFISKGKQNIYVRSTILQINSIIPEQASDKYFSMVYVRRGTLSMLLYAVLTYRNFHWSC